MIKIRLIFYAENDTTVLICRREKYKDSLRWASCASRKKKKLSENQNRGERAEQAVEAVNAQKWKHLCVRTFQKSKKIAVGYLQITCSALALIHLFWDNVPFFKGCVTQKGRYNLEWVFYKLSIDNFVYLCMQQQKSSNFPRIVKKH